MQEHGRCAHDRHCHEHADDAREFKTNEHRNQNHQRISSDGFTHDLWHEDVVFSLLDQDIEPQDKQGQRQGIFNSENRESDKRKCENKAREDKLAQQPIADFFLDFFREARDIRLMLVRCQGFDEIFHAVLGRDQVKEKYQNAHELREAPDHADSCLEKIISKVFEPLAEAGKRGANAEVVQGPGEHVSLGGQFIFYISDAAGQLAELGDHDRHHEIHGQSQKREKNQINHEHGNPPRQFDFAVEPVDKRIHGRSQNHGYDEHKNNLADDVERHDQKRSQNDLYKGCGRDVYRDFFGTIFHVGILSQTQQFGYLRPGFRGADHRQVHAVVLENILRHPLDIRRRHLIHQLENLFRFQDFLAKSQLFEIPGQQALAVLERQSHGAFDVFI